MDNTAAASSHAQIMPNDAIAVSNDTLAPPARTHSMPYGAEPLPGGGVCFRLWAPGCDQIGLALEGRPEPLPMRAQSEGWHALTVADAAAGARYRFVLPDNTQVPDPASRFQPEDVHGPSEVIDPAGYRWADLEWGGRPWHETVLYELHIGAFTPQGSFRGAIARLDHLAALGVNAIEIMPIADFPGRWNWGYDGVLLYAPDSSYGRPEDLKALVDAAHARGISVLLDVVYNHFGPDGNYLPLYVPQLFTERHKTPWGNAINYDGAGSTPIREFVIHNALYWIEEFHLDGLRLDAVHAIIDDSPRHLLNELAERVRASVADRPIHLILENEDNQASRLARDPDNQPRRYTAQWNDDVHHALHTAATGEAQGYYAEYQGETCRLGRALAEGFAFQGETMAYSGKPRGEPSADLPPDAFVAFMQNHDQIGNRAFGDRIGGTASLAALRAVSAIYLLLPQVPMLFMGEEFAASQPFPFFCDFSGDLGQAVVEGRRQEFASFPEFRDPEMRERIPDPQAQTTFASARLAWDDMRDPSHADWLDWYRRVLAVRRDAIVPLIPGVSRGAAKYECVGDSAVAISWRIGRRGELCLAANLSAVPVSGFPIDPGRRVLWQEGRGGEDGALGAWSVLWTLAATPA